MRKSVFIRFATLHLHDEITYSIPAFESMASRRSVIMAVAAAACLLALCSSPVECGTAARMSLLSKPSDRTSGASSLRSLLTQPSRMSLRGGAPVAEAVKTDGPKLQIVFVSAEIAPWSVTGGLGAVSSLFSISLIRTNLFRMSHRHHTFGSYPLIVVCAYELLTATFFFRFAMVCRALWPSKATA